MSAGHTPAGRRIISSRGDLLAYPIRPAPGAARRGRRCDRPDRCAAPPADAVPSGGAVGRSAGGAGAVDSRAAVAQLATPPVKGRAPKTGHDREGRYGQAWSDDVTVAGGRGGCDTRNDILTRDLSRVGYQDGTGNCVVASGTVSDRYTGTTLD